MDAGELDYTYRDYSYPVESWGRPENVVAGIEAHNDVVRALATAHPDVVFVDQERLVAPTKENFVDICHFTNPGSRRFVKNMLPDVLRALEPSSSSSAR